MVPYGTSRFSRQPANRLCLRFADFGIVARIRQRIDVGSEFHARGHSREPLCGVLRMGKHDVGYRKAVENTELLFILLKTRLIKVAFDKQVYVG